MVGYYDVVLGLIPLTFATVTAALAGLGFGLTTAVALASSVPVALICHAMFVRAPVDVSGPSGLSRETHSSQDVQPAD